MTMTDTPRIYVASLSDHNAGILHGVWIDADQDADAIQEEIAAMLAESPTAAREGSPAEEWAIHDHEHLGMISEYESIEKVSALGLAVAEHGAAYLAYADNVGADYATVGGFEEDYCGEYGSEEEYAQELADDIGAVPDDLSWPLSYIDWERATRDLFMSDFYSVPSDPGVYVFRAS